MRARIALFVMLLAVAAMAGIPRMIQYQGKLTDMAGIGENDTLDIRFNIYDVETGGDSLWAMTIADVPIVHGMFDVNLGPIDLPFNEQYWLEIVVDGNVLAPRVQLTSSPYAFRSAVADSFTGGVSPWTQDTMIAHWDSLRAIPADIADGDDFETNTIDTNIAHWGDIRDIPADIADGDQIDTTIAHWASLRDIPPGFADGVDDTGHFEPNTIDTNIAHWGDIRDIPADIADGDQIDTTIAHWGDIRDIPADIADGDDFEANTVDTNIAHWGDIRDIPADIADGDSLGFQQLRANGSAWLTDSVTFVEGVNITLTQTGDTIEIAATGGSANGWVDDGTVVRLETATDNVGIGTTSPTAQLHLEGIGTGEGNALFLGEQKITSPGDPPIEGTGTRMMWYPDKAAFRAGYVDGVEWDKDSIGLQSVAMGNSSTASGFTSTAIGYYPNASGNYSTAMGAFTKASGGVSTAFGYFTSASGEVSTAMGYLTEASGSYSTAMGERTNAPSAYETVIGRYNIEYTPASVEDWESDDRLFVIGNGENNSSRSNAMTVLKKGDIGIGTTTPEAKLDVVGNGSFTGTVSGADAVNDDEFMTKRQVDTVVDELAWIDTTGFVYNKNATSTIDRIWAEDDGDLRVNEGGLTIGHWTESASGLVIAEWTGSIAIPDFGCADGTAGDCGDASFVEVTATASGITYEILFVEIEINISHSYIEDLNIWLVSPEGTEVCLSDDNGLLSADFTNTIFSDTATTSITSVNALDEPHTGYYSPESPLSVLSGEDPNGIWRLRVCDDFLNDVGEITEFRVYFNGVRSIIHEPGAGNIIVEGNVGIGTATPANPLDVVGSGSFTGTVSGADATSDNEFVTKGQVDAGTTVGSWAQSGSDIYNTNTGNVGIGTTSPGAMLEVDGSTTSIDAIYIRNSGLDGLRIHNPDDDGIHLDSLGDDGIEIWDPNDVGIYIKRAGNDGIKIDEPVEEGIVIDNAGINGILIRYYAADGIKIEDGWSGIKIDGTTSDGIKVIDAGNIGVNIDSPGTGMTISNAYYYGIGVSYPGGNGVQVNTPGGDCYVCDGSPVARFRVSRDCEVYSPAYSRYIIDAFGVGLAAPISATTQTWLEHIGEGRLSGGECRVDLPADFLEGVTISEGLPMQVFLTPYGNLGDYTVERYATYFILKQIEGDPSASFAYKVHARIRGSENIGIEHVNLQEETDQDEDEHFDREEEYERLKREHERK